MQLTMTSSLHPNLVVCPNTKAHSILFTKLRDEQTSSESFVRYAKRSMRLLAEGRERRPSECCLSDQLSIHSNCPFFFLLDALAELPTVDIDITTPCGPCQGVQGPHPSSVCAVSIVRSGDALLEAVRDIEPGIRVGKILIQRDESHPEKLPTLFYSKMPPGVENMHVLLCDPMLATGGSAVMAIETLVGKYTVDPANIVFANMICAPEGLNVMAEKYPQVKIVTVMMDEKLNNDKFIVPGLGDYGDRFFNT
eukprot:scaffold13478_cov132-Cylindrotheca_fusiformis.AAC.5